MCILFYFTSKVAPALIIAYIQVLIYLFLIERVHLVRGRSRMTRWKDRQYRINMAGLIPYCVIGLLALYFRVYKIQENGRCVIGIERQTSIMVIVYDLLINVIPLFRLPNNSCI